MGRFGTSHSNNKCPLRKADCQYCRRLCCSFQLQSHAPSRPDGTPQQVFIFKPEGVQQARVDRTVAILVDDSLQAAVEELQEAAHSAPQPPSLSLLCIAWSTILGRFG